MSKIGTKGWLAIVGGVLALSGAAFFLIKRNGEKTANSDGLGLDAADFDMDTDTGTTGADNPYDNPTDQEKQVERDTYYEKSLQQVRYATAAYWHVRFNGRPKPTSGDKLKLYVWGKQIYTRAGSPNNIKAQELVEAENMAKSKFGF